MAFIAVPNAAMVEIRQTYFGQQIENTLYFEFPSAPNPTDLQGLADDIDTWFTSQVLSVGLVSTLVYNETYVTDLATATSPTAVSTVNAGDTGSDNVSAGMPGNVTICMSIRTSSRGRSSRGRNYISGIAEGAVTGNQFSSTLAASLTAAYEQLITTPPTGWSWVVVSRYSNGAPRATGLKIPVTSVGVVDLNVDSQRRRLTGRGR